MLHRYRSATFAVVLTAILAVAPVVGSAPAAERNEPRRVLIVSVPRLTWSEVSSQRPRNLLRFLRGASVASMSTRTVGSQTASADAYLTIGAGNRASSLVASMPGDAAGVSDPTQNGPAADVYRRRTGIRPTGEVVALSVAAQIARNEELLYGAVPGSFASALAGSRRSVGVVGNADRGGTADIPQREVALAGMRRDGQVAVGDVSDSLLVADPLAPFGVRTDVDAMVASVRRGWDTAAVQIVEMSDLERAEQARVESTLTEGDRQFAAALRRSDVALRRILDTVDVHRDLVIVVSPTAPLEAEQLTVFGMRGPGTVPGWARSATTRRDGFVTLTDIAPTILDRWGITPPSTMNDTRITSVASGMSSAARIGTMIRDSERSLFRDEVTGPITVAFIVVLVLLLLAVMWAVARSYRGWRGVLQWWSLALVAAPSAMYLSGLLPYGRFVGPTYALTVAAASMLFAALALTVERWDPVAPPVLLCLVAIVVLGVDIVTGGNLQLNTPFGYSPIVAGRFAGYGNQAFSILTISALVAVTGGWEIWGRRRPDVGDLRRALAASSLFLVVIVLDGAPEWGSDVGGVISTIPAFAVCLLLLLGKRIRLRAVALIAACTLGVLVLFAAVDLARPVGDRTHLGRFAQKLMDGDGVIILQRKLEANMSILTSTVWTLVIPVALMFVAYLTWRPNGLMRRLNEDHVGFRAFGVSGLVLGTVAWAVNDSGVSIPALMLTVALPYTAYLVLGFDGPVGADRRDGPLAADPAVAAADLVTGLLDGGAPG